MSLRMIGGMIGILALSGTALAQEDHESSSRHYFSTTINWTLGIGEALPLSWTADYKHWGDATPMPAGYTVSKSANYPGWAPNGPNPQWDNKPLNIPAATSAFNLGSKAYSTWDLNYKIRDANGVKQPGISGTVDAWARTPWFTRGAKADSRTRFSDPWSFTLLAGEPGRLSIFQEFDDRSRASAAPSSGGSGWAAMSRAYYADVFDGQGNSLESTTLMDLSVGTDGSRMAFDIGQGVTLSDGSTRSSKLAGLYAGLDAVGHTWGLPTGGSIDLSFDWDIPAASYDRTIVLSWDIGADASAISSAPAPGSAALLVAGLATAARRRRR